VTGQLLALMDYSRLNPLRVGAAGGLAARYLAPTGTRTLGVLGSGQQARTQVQAVCRALPAIERVRVYSPTPAHREAFAEEMSGWLEVSTEAVTSVDEAVRDADVVVVASGSPVPVLERSQVRPGALVISVAVAQLPPEFADTTRIVAITWEAIADNVMGREPYATRIPAGTFTRADLAAELPAVIAGEAVPRRTPDDVVLFELTASHVHDLAIARWAYDWARANGVGTPFVLSTD
jgi:ornithine cyclodeaminase/alanine dehydrogenase-like protein (mu-crystallin family)